MKNFIYVIGVCSLLFSCNSELETLPEAFNTEGTAPLVTRVAAHPKYGVLGWGYDVTGNYMNHGKGVTLPVIDIDRFEAENYNGPRCDHYVMIAWQGNKKGDYVYEGNAGYVYP